jgi:hypothetical protein
MSMWNMTWPKLLDFGVANFQTNLSIMCSGSSIRSFLAPHVSFKKIWIPSGNLT